MKPPIKNVEFIFFDSIKIATKIRDIEKLKVIDESGNYLKIISFDFDERFLYLKLSRDINLKHTYFVLHEKIKYEINPLPLVDDPLFDHKYAYSGNLGALYSKKQTTFRVWAPFAKEVHLLLKKDMLTKIAKERIMTRKDRGVFELTMVGDYELYLYQYRVNNFNDVRVSVDPYSLALLDNGHYSVVVNLARKLDVLYKDKLPAISSPTEAVIYETHVRDFTIDPHTKIKNKGLFLGFQEKLKNGKCPVGLNYLKEMNISHVQLLPVYNCATLDDYDRDRFYNWGYDTNHYFSLENTLSTEPFDPYKIINEFQKLVNSLHREGIRVNLDVVYNHINRYEDSCFQKLVPFYYFRRDAENKISNGSFCGNEIASERAMASRLIIDSLVYYTKHFGIDGFRFDLLGLIDIKTMQKANIILRKLDQNIMLYGEGWLMPSSLELHKRATWQSAKFLEDYGFFNDMQRDLYKSRHFSVTGGYLMGDTSYLDGFKYAYMGSTVPHVYDSRFTSARQSINYVECHDNESLYDYLTMYFKDELESPEILKRQELLNVVTLFSYGVPFVHMAQEFGQSKNGHHNTYNTGDRHNMLRYELLSKRYDMANRFHHLIKMRRELSFFHFETGPSITRAVNFICLNDDPSCLMIDYNPEMYFEYSRFAIIINVSFEEKKVALSEFTHYFDLHDRFKFVSLPENKEIIIPPSGYLIIMKE